MSNKQVLKEPEETEEEMSEEELEESTEKILELKKNTNKHFIEIGEELFKVKKRLPHGEWLPWIEKELDFSRSTAHRFIQVYQNPELLKNIWGTKCRVNATFEPIPAGTFNIIYADPPWRYEHPISESRKIEKQYPTLELEQIKEMPLPETEENAILFLWATAPKLEEALEVMNAWGFKYRTHCVWDKEIIGMGYWFRGQHELLLVGVKGRVSPPEVSLRISSIIVSRRTEHSKKPEVIYDLIEKWFPNQTYIELFSREERENWISWGNEI